MSPLTESTRLTLAKGQPFPNDPYFAFNSLLLHGNGTNGSTVITDSSGSPKTVTAVGNAQISTAQSKFGGASIAFDGAGDYLSTTLPAFGVNDFTIELWVRFSSFVNYRMFFDTRAGDSDLLGFVWGTNAAGQLFIYRSGFVLTTGALSLNTWTHVALTRASGVWRIFVDGTLQAGTYTSFGDLTRTVARIGMDWATLYGMNGYIDDLRITKDIARYTSNFTPPTAPFPDF
jgi:hypothetical protein